MGPPLSLRHNSKANQNYVALLSTHTSSHSLYLKSRFELGSYVE